ncbi:hypothetical protein YC2023_059682 [Brassica napus]
MENSCLGQLEVEDGENLMTLVQAFPKWILNIYHALLPAIGGKGLYGMRVHKCVLASGAR